jgi:hypothetical protein
MFDPMQCSFLLRVLAISLALFVLDAAHPGVAQPRLSLPSGDRVDLGLVFESIDTHYRIVLRNDGNDTLRIRRVTTSCGCTATSIRDESIAPGDTGAIDAKFINANINGPSVRHVYILSSDTSAKPVDITFTATVLPVLRADPRYVSFGTIRLHETATRIFRLENTVDDTIRILSARSGDPRIRVSVDQKTVPPHTAVHVRTVCVASTPAKLLGEIAFATDSKLKPLLKVSYVGKIVGQ